MATLSDPILRALRACFGADAPTSGEPLGGGLSGTPLFAVAHGGRRYVVRHVDGARPFDAPAHQIACITTAAEAGVAPPVRYADPTSGVVVMDYVAPVDGRGWLRDPPGIARVAALFRRLHDGPAFAPFIAIPDALPTMLARLVELGAAPPPLCDAAPAFPAIAAALARHAEPRPCHHDANPGNLLFDGARLWLIDWELAGAGDPFYDLGSLCVYAYPGPEERALLLASYLERPPTAVERARLAVATAQALAFYAVVFATLGTLRGGAAPAAFPAEQDVPTLIDALASAPARGTAPEPAWMGAVLAWELARVVRSDAHREAIAALSQGRPARETTAAP